MDRALREPLVVAATPTNGNSGYQSLTNVQLAAEVQKFSGYNHFSSSAANLLEEVVRRLMMTTVPAEVIQAMGNYSSVPLKTWVPSNAPKDLPASERPVAPGSTIRIADLEEARAVIRVDMSKVQRKDRFKVMYKHLRDQQISEEEAHLMVSEFKGMYNLSQIISQGGLNNRELAIYWLLPNRPGMTGLGGVSANIYWRWE